MTHPKLLKSAPSDAVGEAAGTIGEAVAPRLRQHRMRAQFLGTHPGRLAGVSNAEQHIRCVLSLLDALSTLEANGADYVTTPLLVRRAAVALRRAADVLDAAERALGIAPEPPAVNSEWPLSQLGSVGTARVKAVREELASMVVDVEVQAPDGTPRVLTLTLDEFHSAFMPRP